MVKSLPVPWLQPAEEAQAPALRTHKDRRLLPRSGLGEVDFFFIRVGLMKLTCKYILLITIPGSSLLGRFVKAKGFM